jgi:GTP cyclohydrolase I
MRLMRVEDSTELGGAPTRLAGLVREQLALLGEDPAREGLARTPERVAESMEFLTRGYGQTAAGVVVFALRLQVQERLTEQIAEAIDDVLRREGVGLVVEAEHLCMMMRGIEKQNSRTITSALRGSFRDDARTRDEFLRLAHR